jgi:hypothetical protein
MGHNLNSNADNPELSNPNVTASTRCETFSNDLAF